MTARRLRRRILMVSAAILLLAALAYLAGPALVVEVPVDNPEAILSLASHEWERLPDAARLARQYPAARVVLSVPKQINRYNCHKCGERAQRLWEMGIPASRIDLMRDRVDNTYDEAKAARTYMLAHRRSRLLVVSSPYHTRRTLLTFRSVFAGTNLSIGTHPTTAASKATPTRWFLRRYDRNYVQYEWAAIVYYRYRYGVPLW